MKIKIEQIEARDIESFRAALASLRESARARGKVGAELMDDDAHTVVAILRAAAAAENAIPRAEAMHVVASALWAFMNDVDESEVTPESVAGCAFVAFATACRMMDAASNLRYATDCAIGGAFFESNHAEECAAEVLRQVEAQEDDAE
jgi:hypothetical protein